jgi:hypothetical protein
MYLTSSAFSHQARIPTRYTCDGEDLSPPLTIDGIPEGTAALVLIVDDPDAPHDVWDHWVAYDIPPEGVIPEGVSNVGTGGRNSWGRTGYGGPCPPPGGSHRYIFSIYAIDTTLGLGEGVDKGAVLNAIQGHILDEAELIGRYSR